MQATVKKTAMGIMLWSISKKINAVMKCRQKNKTFIDLHSVDGADMFLESVPGVPV